MPTTSQPMAFTSTAATSRPRIIWVGDEPSALVGLELVLNREHEVDAASSDAAGLELLESRDPVPVVVADMRMPNMSGAEFVDEVAARYPNTSRILPTRASDIESAVHAVNAAISSASCLSPVHKITCGEH